MRGGKCGMDRQRGGYPLPGDLGFFTGKPFGPTRGTRRLFFNREGCWDWVEAGTAPHPGSLARTKATDGCHGKGGWAFLPDITRTVGVENARRVCGDTLIVQDGASCFSARIQSGYMCRWRASCPTCLLCRAGKPNPLCCEHNPCSVVDTICLRPAAALRSFAADIFCAI